MPAFVRTKSDEHRWSKAKQAVKESRKKGEESFEDQDWALVNSIYHKMHKSEIAGDILELLKAKEDDDDEDEGLDVQDWGDAPEGEEDLENQGMRTFDPDEEGSDEADAWLNANDPDKKAAATPAAGAEETGDAPEEESKEEVRPTSGAGYTDWQPRSDYSPDEASKIKELTAEGYSPREAERMAGAHKGPANFQDALTHTVRPSEMSPKMMAELKELAGHYLGGLENQSKLRAESDKNPMKHASGKLLEAHDTATKDYSEAYNALLNSDAVKNLKGIDRVKAIQKWKKDYAEKNPNHHEAALAGIHGNKEHLATAHAEHGSIKEPGKNVAERMRHLETGGAHDPESSFTAAEAAQHAGGGKTDEGYSATTVVDPAASFAAKNKASLDKIKGSLKPEQLDRMKHVDTARTMLNVKPTVIRRPGGNQV